VTGVRTAVCTRRNRRILIGPGTSSSVLSGAILTERFLLAVVIMAPAAKSHWARTDQRDLHGQEKSRIAISPFCPSAQPCMEGSVVLGVVGGTVEEPQVAYLNKPLPVTEDVLALTGPVTPTEVIRFAAPCAAHACQHFDGAKCRLATRVVNLLPMAVDRLPPCHLRPKCRWWRQEGRAACMRCPIIVTETIGPSDLMRMTADPNSKEGLDENGNE
jgi:hypothetical protein